MTPDARTPDARTPDARTPDARTPDARTPDAPMPDADDARRGGACFGGVCSSVATIAFAAVIGVGCGGAPSNAVALAPNDAGATAEGTPADKPAALDDAAAIGEVIDDWHAAAAASNEEQYFALMSPDAVFLGTDRTERWSKAAFRAYAHPHFEKGKAWAFKSVRRTIILGHCGEGRLGNLAWFDEDLATPNLGPARGSGVVRRDGGRWLIVHYNLAITVPNERFESVRKLLSSEPPLLRPPSSPPPPSPK